MAQVALDTASSSRPSIITSFGSTCDSSSCTLCQPIASTGKKQETDFASISSISRASSRSTATLEGYQISLGLQKRGSAAQPLEQDENCAIAGSSSSHVSSQSEQGMRYGHLLGDRTSRKRGAMDDSAAELGLFGIADDFISVERADLRRSYASSSNLLQNAMEEPKRRCISRPASSESCGEQSGLDCDRWGCGSCPAYLCCTPLSRVSFYPHFHPHACLQHIQARSALLLLHYDKALQVACVVGYETVSAASGLMCPAGSGGQSGKYRRSQ